MEYFGVIDRIENGIAVIVRDSDEKIFRFETHGDFFENQRVVISEKDGEISIRAKEGAKPEKESNGDRLRRLFNRNK